MKKNISGQVIGAQLITAADGTAFTGAVSVLYTVDGGTQTAGGGTAPTHEGNGFHTYTPLQAETNGDHVAFTFIGTGAIPATIQVYTNTPQSEDNATKLSNIPTVIEFEARTLPAANYFDPAVDTVANVTLVDTTTTNTDMRGTDSALLAASYTAPDNAGITAADNSTQISALNDVTAAEVRSEIDSNSVVLFNILGDTNDLQSNQGDWATATGFSTFNPATDVVANVTLVDTTTDITNGGSGGATEAQVQTIVDGLNDFNPATDVVANVTLVDTTTTNTDMRGTDSANTVTPATEAQLNARTIPAANYFDPAIDPVANVTLVDTTTTNTDMRGTDNALLNSSYTSPDNAGIAQTLVDISALNNISVSDILNTTMTESYAADGNEATLAQGIYNIQQNLCEFSYVGTTKTTKKINGTSTAATYTLDDSVNPSSMIRSS